MQISEQSAKQNLGIEPAPHVHARMSTRRLMIYLLLSLIPALAVITFYFGCGTLWQFVLCTVVALACQVMAAFLRGRSVKMALKDPSGIVTALLLAITLPPLLPWYFTVLAMAFAMLIVRECFGGLGMNLFNPAMAGFIFLVISVPGMFYQTWITPAPQAVLLATPVRTANIIFNGEDPRMLVSEIIELNTRMEADGDTYLDVLTGATFLESNKTARKAGTVDKLIKIDFTSSSFQAYLALAIAYAIGGLSLIYLRVIRFQVPLTFLLTIAIVGSLWHYLDPSMSINGVEHLLLGGTMLGAFYIITDPVTTCGTFKGRILFAFIIACLIILIRVKGSYSDSVAFAVLLGNCLAPLIDVMTKRRPFGIGYRTGGLQ